MPVSSIHTHTHTHTHPHTHTHTRTPAHPHTRTAYVRTIVPGVSSSHACSVSLYDNTELPLPATNIRK